MYSPSGHPRWRLFCFSLEQICSPINPLQWMGAVRMRVQTADKNISIIQTTPVHVLTSVNMCLRKKSIIETFFYFKPLFVVSLSSPSIILLSPVKKSSSLNQEKNMHRSSTISKSKQICLYLQDVNWWTGVVWISVIFFIFCLSAVWTLILTAPIHCKKSIGEQVM